LADILDLPVERPSDVETTALGAAMLAGMGAGMFSSLDTASEMRSRYRAFHVDMKGEVRAERLAAWGRVLATAQ
jgi:glycerol kinase